MGTTTQLIRNKSSPEKNQTKGSRSVYQKLIDQINEVGAGIWRVEGTSRGNGTTIDRRFSGLLLDVNVKNGDLIYSLVNGGEHEVAVKDAEKCFRWRRLIEPGRTYQFIPVTKTDKLTLQPGRVTRILKVGPEELENQLQDYKKGRRK